MIASNVLIRNMVRGFKGYSRLMEGLAVYYWPQVIGSAFEKKTVAEKVFAGTLWVRTEEPTIAHQLSFFIPRILKGYKELLGEGVVKSVRFTVGQIQLPRDVEDDQRAKEIIPVDSTVVPEVVLDSANTIADEQLQASFLRLAKSSYSRRSHLQKMGWKVCSCGIMTEDGGLCVECLRKESEEQRDALTFFISKYPGLGYEEVKKNLPNVKKDDWEKIRERLRQVTEDEIVLRAKEIRRSKNIKMLMLLINPCLRYVKLGGDEKKLGFLLGSDLWNGLRALMVEESKDVVN